MTDKMDIRLLAEYMHDIYEEESIKTGWKTQKNCRVHFYNLPEANQKVMLNIAERLLENRFFQEMFREQK